jgi:hypothetical protein
MGDSEFMGDTEFVGDTQFMGDTGAAFMRESDPPPSRKERL